MDRYHFEPLPPDGKHIRLAVLHPRASARPDDIRITIYQTPLDARRRLLPSFMALSYVWGDVSDRRDVTVVESTDTTAEYLASARRLSITANLAEALGHLPYADSHLVLWIDAVCINQQDLDERARQVALMAEIYASAERVLAWTGASTPDSNVAINLVHRIADSIDVDSASLALRPRASRWTRESDTAGMYFGLLLDERLALPWDGPESRALEAFLARPWFERLWVRQEMTLGARDAVLLCGSSSVQWAKFQKAAVWLNNKAKDPRHPRLAAWTARTGLVADTAVRGASCLGQLLRQMQRTECADARDRIYGVLGILPAASRGLATRITPDYSKPVANVYRDLVLAEMEVTRRADLVSECRSAVHPTCAADWRPTWVPNWTVKRQRDRERSMRPQCADGQSAVSARVVDGGHALAMQGVLAATIVDVIPLVVAARDAPPQAPMLPAVVALLQAIAAKLHLSDTRADSIPDALCYALLGGWLADDMADEMGSATTITTTTTPTISQFKRLVRFALDAEPTEPTEPDGDVMTGIFVCIAAMVQACEDMALLTTEEGFVGAGPTLARPGDQIAVMLGCMRPLVLRAHTHRHTIVGPCHAHGLNWGEALLGPLPQDVRFTWSASGPVFRNRNTGEEDAAADPRIDRALLGVGPKHEGERARPDAAYFAKKGIKLRTFTLV